MQNSDTEKQYQWIDLREKINRNAHYLMGISMVSCRFSLKPTDWHYINEQYIYILYYIDSVFNVMYVIMNDHFGMGQKSDTFGH